MSRVTNRHIMQSNIRLIYAIKKSIFKGSDDAWCKVYSEICKRHGELMPNRVMQFKFKGIHFHLKDDTRLYSGVQQLHPSLVDEFQQAFKMFVTDANEERRIAQNMIAHAIRISKYTEDLLELLPASMHEAITDAGFFQPENKPPMSIDDVNGFKELYSEQMSIFDVRKFLGVSM